MIRVIGFAARKIDDRYMRKRASRFAARKSIDGKEEKRRDRRRAMKKNIVVDLFATPIGENAKEARSNRQKC